MISTSCEIEIFNCLLEQRKRTMKLSFPRGPYYGLQMFILLMAIFGVQAKEDIKIDRISPNGGGYGGLVKITAYGQNFDVDFDWNSKEPRTKMYLVSGERQYECDFKPVESNERQAVCYTRLMEMNRSYYLRMKVVDKWLEEKQYCRGAWNNYRCRYYAYHPLNSGNIWYSPTITTLDHISATPHSLITISGKIITDKVDLSNGTASNGRTEVLQRVWLTAGECSLYRDVDELFGVRVSSNSYDGTIKCKISSSYVGNQNVSFVVSGLVGRSIANLDTRHLSADNHIYMLQTYAVVEDVYPKMGSVIGGVRLKIKGKFFDDRSGIKAKVMIGERSCKVESVTDNEIICVVGPKPDAKKSFYPGGRGAKIEMVASKNQTFNDTDADGYLQHFSDSISICTGNRLKSRSAGFFIPSVTGNYKFDFSNPKTTARCYSCKLYMDFGRGLELVTERGSTSLPKALEKGTNYYYEASIEANSGCDLSMKLNAFVDETKFTLEQLPSVTGSQHDISATSFVVKEEQLIETKLWQNRDSVNTELNLTLSCNTTCFGQQFRISVAEMKTVWMDYDVEEDIISTHMGKLDVFTSEENVAVIKSMKENTTSYHITIQSGRGDFFPYVNVESTPLLDGKLTSLVAGSPDYKTVTFEHGGFLSKPIPTNSTAEQMRAAVVELFTPKCPQDYRERLMSKAFIFYDMEDVDTTPRYGRRSVADSLCGSYSLDSGYAYYDYANPIRLNNYKYFCFAYVGGTRNYVYVDVEFKEISATRQYWRHLFLDGLVVTSSWKYLCYNLDDELKSEYPSGRDFQIRRLRFYADNTMFVDDIYFGADVPDMMEIQGYLDKRIPPAVPHIKLKEVIIRKTSENSSQIQMTSNNCEHDYPLLGFGFLGKQEVISGNETLYGKGRNYSQIHVTRLASASPPIAGTFDINFENGEFDSIPNIPVNITADELQTLLESVDGIEKVDVGQSRNCDRYSWWINYKVPSGSVPNIIMNGTKLTGNNPSVGQSVSRVGGIEMRPIRGDYLRTAHNKPQVQVYINNIPSTCEGDFDNNSNTSCDFEWMESMTATVETVKPSTGSQSTTIVITGSGFDDSVITNNEVLIADVRCDVISASQTSISCTIGKSPAGVDQPLVVRITGKGYARMANHTKTFTVLSNIHSVTPSNGSMAGCSEVTIVGAGFEDSIASVKLGEVACDVISVTHNEIRCVSGSSTTPGVVDITVKFMNGVEVVGSNMFHFLSSSSVGQITSISRRTLRVAGGENLTLYGSRLESSGSVALGEHQVSVLSWKDDEITIRTPSLSPGNYQLKVKITGRGCALNVNETFVNYEFSISSITPMHGSLLGGTQVTVNGSGFNDDVAVMIGESPCDVIDSDDDSLVCITSPTTALHRVDNMGSHKTYGIGYGWKPAVLHIKLGDEVNFRWATPESVDGIKIGPFTCSDPISEEYDGDGFNVPPTPSGSFTYRFSKTGTFYYKSIVKADITMLGRVIVSDRTEILSNISASIGQYKAMESESLVFTSDLEHTPLVHAISPNVMDIHTELELNITNLFTTPNIVVGGRSCEITGNTSTSLTCRISKEQMLPVGRHGVVVSVPPVGNALLAINNLEDRSIIFYPTLDNISPINGSMEGNTLLTIEGSGFTTSTRVLIGTYLNCKIRDVTYSAIKCWTPKFSSIETFDVNILESGIQPNNSGVFTFSYLAERTPIVSNITILTNKTHYNLTMTGTGFGSNFSYVTVDVGGSKCMIIADTFSDGQFSCEMIEQLPVGRNAITVHVGGKGLAQISSSTLNWVESKAVIFSVYPQRGSLEGGTEVKIEGNGFVEGKTIVRVGERNCNITSVTVGSITFVTNPSLQGTSSVEVISDSYNYPRTFTYFHTTDNTPTVDSISPSSAYQGQIITMEGTKFGNQSSLVSITSATYGTSLCNITTINDTQIVCTLNAYEGGPVDIQMHVQGQGFAKFNSEFSYLLSIDSISPTSGSFGGHQEVTINGQGFSNRSVAIIGGKKCEIISQTQTRIVCSTPAQLNTTVATQQADVVVMNGDSLSSNVTYNYLLNETALVSGVSPNRGGTGGGTNVTITGTNFRLSGSMDPIVKIGGIECKLHEYTDTTILCETEPRPHGSIEAQIEVFIGDYGIARQDNAYFYYIDRWSSKFTWGGSDIPTTKDFVVIPKGKTVLLDTHTAVLVMLVIDGGKLIFDDTQDVSLHAENILLTSGGVLQVGTEDKPYEANAEIVLYGHVRSPELPIYGAKTLAVREGLLDLHGRHIPVTWSKLSETALKGSTEIKLHHSVNWRINDEIAIATTGSRRSQEQNEKRKIKSISADGKTITLDRALDFEHLGVEETFGNQTVEFRAEVGLLSRNIVIRGSNDPQWHDQIARCEEGFDTGVGAIQTCFQGRFGEEIGSDQFGGTVMIHARNASSMLAVAKIEYVEMTYMGQAFRLRRYPIHWHLMGDVRGSYVRGCSIHKTFNRAVAIHGTDNLLVDRNVIYDVMGSGIFLEDGIETGNVIQYNLAMFVKQSTSLLNIDITPAAYWVTNPNNTLTHNHAAGGTHFGFWYRLIQFYDGNSYTRPYNTKLGRFENNTVHSQGRIGLWIYPSYTPSRSSPARFKSLTTWNSEKGAEWVDGGAIQFHDFVMVNNDVTGIEMKMVLSTGYGYDDGAMVKGGLIAGHSTISNPAFETAVGITLPFAPGLTVEGVDFHNFDRAGVAFKITSISGICTNLCGGFYYIMRGLSFKNVKRKMFWRWEHEGVLEDEDGSLTGSSGNRVVPISGLVKSSLCQEMFGDEFSSGEVKSLRCPPSVRFHRFALNSVRPSSLYWKNMIITNKHGSSMIPYANKRLTHTGGWMALLYSGETHTVEWNSSYKFTNISYNSRFYDFFEDDYVFIRHALASVPDVIEIGPHLGNVSESTPINSASDNLQWHFDPNTRNLDYIVANHKTGRRRKRARPSGVIENGIRHISVSPQVYRCKNIGCVPDLDGDQLSPVRDIPTNAYTFTWSSLGLGSEPRNVSSNHPCVVLKDNSSSVEILQSVSVLGIELCWCIIDVPTINIRHLIIKGVVQFSNDVDFEAFQFSANTIQVLGGRIIAGYLPEDPFTKKLTINLKGKPADGNDVHFRDVALGTKALGCFGGCDLHGINHNVYWTHLSQTVEAGATILWLTEEVDWTVGDEIVITTTSYSSQQTEKRVITSVSGSQITVDSPLSHRHLGNSYTINSKTLDMRAEVGLLSRNIKIQGEKYDGIDDDEFGARVIVGYLSSSDIYGWARISNVEFHRVGQEGFIDSYDPRFALVWLDTGLVVPARPSFVQNSAFHDCYSTGIGVFGGDGIKITNNIVHRPLHHGIRIGGSNTRVERNLVTNAVTRGVGLQASFKLTEGTNITLIDNVAAGSQLLCFDTNGVDCDNPSVQTWRGNVAHGCRHGVHMMSGSSRWKCSLLENFVIYKAWNYGVYHQTSSSVIIRNVVIADAQVGYVPIIYGPPSSSHLYEDKTAKVENLLLIGRSDHYDENVDETSDLPGKSDPNGKIGILLPLFQSWSNGAPLRSFIGNTNYPAIRGLLNISGITIYNYKKISSSQRDVVFHTNTQNEDAYTQTHISDVTKIQVDDDSLVLYQRPSISLINPSDCVDMECDGMKNVLIKDLDGSFLGSPGSIIPDAAYGWDDDNMKQRGLGDYRIPKTLLTRTDGTRIDVESIIDHRGIAGTSNCIYRDVWQAYDCHGDDVLDYTMMVIESMDADTETRRLSPVALMANRYVDLQNGPQDHGWCSGYTCQKRLSTFFTLVAISTHYDIYFTGYPPLDLRIHFLNVDNSKTIRLGIYYPKPERLDVYNGDVYIHPLNQALNDEGKLVTKAPRPDQPDEYKPAINASVHGSNYMDRRNDILYVTVRGPGPIDIRTAPAVIVKFGFPAVSIDEFFEENLIFNLASYLGVPAHKIKIVDIVRETARKRRSLSKRSAEIVEYVFEFDDGIVEDDTISGGTTNKTLAAEKINNKTDEMIKDFQIGILSSKLNVTWMELEATVASMELPPKFINETKEVQTKIRIPNKQNSTIPSTLFEELSDFPQPSLTLLDNSDLPVDRLGGKWKAQLVLIPQPGVSAELLGSPVVDFTDGAAVFQGLGISNTGTHTIQFQVVEPTSISIPPTNITIEVIARQIRAIFLQQSNMLMAMNESLTFSLRLTDNNGANLTYIGYKGNQWKARVEVADFSAFNETVVDGQTEFLFDNSTGETGTDGLMLSNATDYYRYMFKVTVFSDPPIYDPKILYTPGIQVYSPENIRHLNTSVEQIYKIRFSGRVQNSTTAINELDSSEAENAFAASFNNHVVDLLNASYVATVTATQSDVNTMVEFRISSRDETVAAEAESKLENRFVNTTEEPFVFDGRSFVIEDPDCFLEVGGICKSSSPETTTDDGSIVTTMKTWQFVLTIIGAILAIGIEEFLFIY